RVRRSVPAHPPRSAANVRTPGPGPLHESADFPDDGGARGGSGRADPWRQVPAAQDSADDAERAGLPAEGSRHAGDWKTGRHGRSVRDGRGRASPVAHQRTTSPVRGAAETRQWHETLRCVNSKAMDINKYTEKARG